MQVLVILSIAPFILLEVGKIIALRSNQMRVSRNVVAYEATQAILQIVALVFAVIEANRDYQDYYRALLILADGLSLFYLVFERAFYLRWRARQDDLRHLKLKK